MNIYEKCPTLESEKFIMRLFRDEDVDDLLQVYSDKLALPFFNSDNRDGDNFYYATKERMTDAIGFWHMAYENGWFVRMSIVDKEVIMSRKMYYMIFLHLLHLDLKKC